MQPLQQLDNKTLRPVPVIFAEARTTGIISVLSARTRLQRPNKPFPAAPEGTQTTRERIRNHSLRIREQVEEEREGSGTHSPFKISQTPHHSHPIRGTNQPIHQASSNEKGNQHPSLSFAIISNKRNKKKGGERVRPSRNLWSGGTRGMSHFSTLNIKPKPSNCSTFSHSR
jgi:hypothetical protein